MKETDLAQHFVDYLSCYDLYFEVDFGSCVDIVALDDKFSIAVEVKTSFSFKVLQQALLNTNWYNYSYIAVPEMRDDWIQRKLCQDYGIGLLTWNTRGYGDVREYIQPKLHRRSNKQLRLRLHEWNKRSAPGSKNGDSLKITAFQITMENIERYVKRHPGCSIKEVIENSVHHYDSNKAAVHNIYGWIYKGVIKTMRLESGKLYFISTDLQTSQPTSPQ